MHYSHYVSEIRICLTIDDTYHLVGHINFLEVHKVMMHFVIDDGLYFIGNMCTILLVVTCLDP